MAQNKKNRPYNGHKNGFTEEEIKEMERIVSQNSKHDRNENEDWEAHLEEMLRDEKGQASYDESHQETTNKKKKVLSWIIAIGSGLALVASGVLAGFAISNASRIGGYNHGSEED